MILDKFSLKDKVAIVTGSGRGIGRAMAVGFAEAGANVVVTARTAKDVEETASEVRARGRKALAVPADAANWEQVSGVAKKAVEEFGHIDILVQNVGGGFGSPFLELSERGWDAIIRRNLKTTFFYCQAVVPYMVKQKKGNVILISSQAGRGPNPHHSAYATSKAGLCNLAATLAGEWAEHNIRVNAIAPGPIVTPGTLEVLFPTKEKEEEAAGRIMLQRLGTPEDVAYAALYLASDASNWVTGITLDVSGGPPGYWREG